MLCRDENDQEIYDEQPKENRQINEFLTTTEAVAQSSRTPKKDQGSARILDSNKGRVQKIARLSLKKVNFGIFRTLLVLFLLLLGNALIQLFFFSTSYPESTKLVNLMQVYCTGVQSWTSFYSLHATFLATILWNNTIDHFGLGSSEKAYE